MPQLTYSYDAPSGAPGLVFDDASVNDGIVSFEAGEALPPGRFVALDANGRAVLATGTLPIIGVTVLRTTTPAPYAQNSVVAIMRQGRIFVEKAVAATQPALGAGVSRHATNGTLVSTGGTAIPGAFGYSRGTTASVVPPTNCALIELNLPSVTSAA